MDRIDGSNSYSWFEEATGGVKQQLPVRVRDKFGLKNDLSYVRTKAAAAAEG
jgi:hypothetical protein